MKYINPGIAALLTSSNTYQGINVAQKYSATGYAIGTAGNHQDKFPWYQGIEGNEDCHEIWMSYDIAEVITGSEGATALFTALDAELNTLACVFLVPSTNGYHIAIYNGKLLPEVFEQKKYIYITDTSVSFNSEAPNNIEVHFKNGENGRVDVWIDTKLFCSYRSPSAFPSTPIKYVGQQGYSEHGYYGLFGYVSSIIIQDTRRIGLEKFKMLTVDPATEQNMPQGSTTTFTLSGLSDATEFSDITSVGAILQATSRDANITTGTFSLNGADLGTIDVSDSSGKAYEIAHAETNSLTGKPWTRDEIEGKTLSFTVNGAS